ncbi:MAG: DMT family transporter [Rhodobacteraceae bacterium]|nr:DMT family transporter [Paracoccaceae bacterium]
MDNLRGAALMVVAMAGFALEDLFIKRLSAEMAVGQILVVLGVGGALAFAAIARAQGKRVLTRELLSKPVMIRNLGELIGTVGYVTAIALTPLSTAAAILQAMPLAVTLGAALFLGETVGWRRWTAICVGFFGVLLILRPGTEGFEPASLFAVQGVIGLAIRDLATRRMPTHISSVALSCYGFAVVVPAGLILLAFGQPATMPAPSAYVEIAIALFFGMGGYLCIVGATRIGEMSVIAPFRYSRIVFALFIGVLVFAERPDAWTLGGAALIVVSGLYTFAREARYRKQSTFPSAATIAIQTPTEDQPRGTETS